MDQQQPIIVTRYKCTCKPCSQKYKPHVISHLTPRVFIYTYCCTHTKKFYHIHSSWRKRTDLCTTEIPLHPIMLYYRSIVWFAFAFIVLTSTSLYSSEYKFKKIEWIFVHKIKNLNFTILIELLGIFQTVSISISIYNMTISMYK